MLLQEQQQQHLHLQHLPQRQHQTHQVTIELYFSTFQKFWNNRNVLCAAKSTTPVHNEATPNTPTAHAAPRATPAARSEEHTSELQSLMRISYAVLCLKKNNT